MQKPQKRLGRGLSSLLTISNEEVEEAVPRSTPHTDRQRENTVNVGMIRPNPYQPRQDIPPEQLQSLADSIKKHGVLQPIIVRPAGENHEIIAGERRWRACQMAGLDTIPAIIREASEEEMLELALIENIFREDLNAIERASAYKRYCDTFNMTADEVALRLGEDRSTVANYLRLLDLPSDVKEWVKQGRLSMGHARCILAIRSPSDLLKTAKQAIDQDLSVRALENLVRQKVAARHQASSPADGATRVKRPQIAHLEQDFIRTLGTKVEIVESRRKGSGKIIIHYYSLDDFDRLSARLEIEPQV